MRRRWIALALFLMLAGCGERSRRADEFPYTPFPYRQDDEFYEIIGKSLVNVPAWTLETTLVTAMVLTYFWLYIGAPGIRR